MCTIEVIHIQPSDVACTMYTLGSLTPHLQDIASHVDIVPNKHHHLSTILNLIGCKRTSFYYSCYTPSSQILCILW